MTTEQLPPRSFAGGIDWDALLTSLAAERPVFHSEADLQHALAWHLRVTHQDVGVRLEVRVPHPTVPDRRERMDLLVRVGGERIAVEIKYLCASLDTSVEGELFRLPNHGAQDVRCFDTVHDIARVEQMVASGFATSGLLLVLANDPSYWSRPRHDRVTGAAAFRLYDGREIGGSLEWGDRSGPGTRKGRDFDVELRNVYRLSWRDFSIVAGAPRGRFRSLVVDVPSRRA